MSGKSKAEKQNDAFWRKQQRLWRKLWLREHPGRSSIEYTSILAREPGDEEFDAMWAWRRAKGQAANAAEDAAWLLDHPGSPLPEHRCSLKGTDAEEYERWTAARL